MRRGLFVSKMAMFVSLAALFVSLADLARQAPTLVHDEALITREVIDNRIAAEADITRIMLDNRMRDALGEVRTATAVVNLRSGQAIDELAATRHMVAVVGLNLAGRADSRLGEVTGEIATLRTDLMPLLASYAALGDSARSAIEDAHPEAVKLIRDARIATAQAGRAAGQIERATPEVLANVKRATDASADASEHASATFANLEKQTKPAPLWMRFAPEVVRTAIIGIGFLN